MSERHLRRGLQQLLVPANGGGMDSGGWRGMGKMLERTLVEKQRAGVLGPSRNVMRWGFKGQQHGPTWNRGVMLARLPQILTGSRTCVIMPNGFSVRRSAKRERARVAEKRAKKCGRQMLREQSASGIGKNGKKPEAKQYKGGRAKVFGGWVGMFGVCPKAAEGPNKIKRRNHTRTADRFVHQKAGMEKKQKKNGPTLNNARSEKNKGSSTNTVREGR